MGTRRCKLLQRRTYPATETGVDLEQLELLDTHPLFTGQCPRCEMTYPKYETPPVHWDCSACGWMDNSV